ncbi:MAG: hypothetical protein KKA42_11135, partial [candidate division Zixibacteria bacterium]|nr:hypothetical protein [candidate division Zixibacteria bacterium]
DPENTDVLQGIGRYFNQLARDARDSSNAYKDLGDSATAKKWSDMTEARFDSGLVYLKQVFELKGDLQSAEEYGLICFIRNDFESARTAFAKAVEVDSTSVDNWTSLGDVNLQLHDFTAAAMAYEKVLALTPTDKQVMERLYDLYQELQRPKRRAAIKKMMDSL